MIENIQEWLQLPVPKEEIELNDDGSEFQPIWVIEKLLDELCNYNWSRHSHRYSLHEIGNSFWLATSIITEIKYNLPPGTVRRNLACSSFLDLSQYTNNSNILQTGIAEATKAGVKVLGSRFGYSLNQRTAKKIREKTKMPPDKKIKEQYARYVSEKNESKVKLLESIYDFTKQ